MVVGDPLAPEDTWLPSALAAVEEPKLAAPHGTLLHTQSYIYGAPVEEAPKIISPIARQKRLVVAAILLSMLAAALGGVAAGQANCAYIYLGHQFGEILGRGTDYTPWSTGFYHWYQMSCGPLVAVPFFFSYFSGFLKEKVNGGRVLFWFWLAITFLYFAATSIVLREQIFPPAPVSHWSLALTTPIHMVFGIIGSALAFWLGKRTSTTLAQNMKIEKFLLPAFLALLPAAFLSSQLLLSHFKLTLLLSISIPFLSAFLVSKSNTKSIKTGTALGLTAAAPFIFYTLLQAPIEFVWFIKYGFDDGSWYYAIESLLCSIVPFLIALGGGLAGGALGARFNRRD